MDEIADLLDQLESKLKAAKRLPRGLMPIVEQLRGAVADQAQAKERLEHERERALAQAREEAERMVGKAREEVERLTDQHEIVQAAKAEAEAILKKASDEAEKVSAGADEYAFEVLCQLEQELSRTLTVVANGLRTLQDKRGYAEPDGNPSSSDGENAAGAESPQS
jgi:cell division septum initiation protein DivIVA